jgi:transglutaminase-like putative cysteine protease
VTTQKANLYSNSDSYRDSQPDGRLVWQPKLAGILNPIEGWMVLVLLAVALYSVIASIIAVRWVDNGSLLLYMPICGLLVGLVIAKIPRFPQSILHLAACLIGHWLAVWLTSAVAFHIPWIQVLAALRAAFSGQAATMGVVAGKVVFFFYLSFLCFFLGYFGCWLVYRAHLPWLVALVYCSIMLVNLNYVRREWDFLIIVLLGSMLLLIARMSLMAQIAQWRREGLRSDQRWLSSIVERCMLVASIITVLALFFSSSLPVLAQPQSGQAFWSSLEVAWNDVITSHFSFQDLNNVLSSLDQSSGNFFSDQLTIADSVHLPTGEVLNYSDDSNSNPASRSQPHYLEGLTYDLFDGHSWRSNLSNSRTYGIGEPLPIKLHGSDVTGSVTVAITQTPQETKYYIFGPEQPFSFSVPTQIYTDGTIGAWAQQTPLNSGEKYNVAFSTPPMDPNMLSQMPLPSNNQSAWNADPYYIQQKANYLQLPGDLSPNVAQTAKQWTNGANNAYEAMKALEEHFNDTSVFTYSLENQPIPPNKDVVDWLLQTRRGYCTYYASAMAIMGRLLGIPTRVVSGFSQGHFDPQHNMWVVDGSDAHSWVQAYLPNLGWVSFDPTPTFAPNAAPSASAQPTPPPVPTPTSSPVPPPAPTQKPQVTPVATVHAAASSKAPVGSPAKSHNQDQGVLIGITIIGLVLAFLFCLALIVRYWWRRFYTSSIVVSVLFWRFCQIASWIGLGPKVWQTPYEYSSMLSRQFPEHAAPFSRLTRLFVRERWGLPQPTPRKLELTDATYLWTAMRSLVLSRFAQLLQSLQVRNILRLLQSMSQMLKNKDGMVL